VKREKNKKVSTVPSFHEQLDNRTVAIRGRTPQRIVVARRRQPVRTRSSFQNPNLIYLLLISNFNEE
jgi:hypothetical protein